MPTEPSFTAMYNLKSLVNLSGEDAIEIVLVNTPEGLTTDTWYKKITTSILEVVEPLVTGYITDMDIEETLKKVETRKQLEETTIEYMPMSIKEALADALDAHEDLTDAQKIFLLVMYLEKLTRDIKTHCDQFFLQRAQQLANQRRIIQPV